MPTTLKFFAFISAETGAAAKPRSMAPAIAPATADRIAVSLFMMTSLIVMTVGKRSRRGRVRQLPRFTSVIPNGRFKFII